MFDTTNGVPRACGPIGDLCYGLYAVLRPVKLADGDKDIVHLFPVVRNKKCKTLRELNDTRKLHFIALQYLYYFAFFALAARFRVNINFYPVAVQRIAQF